MGDLLMAHYDCKECHQDPVSGHAPDCTRGKAMDELIAGDADLYGFPQAFNGCTCMCHRRQGVRHFFPCCGPGAITKEWLKQAVEREGEAEVGAGFAGDPPNEVERLRTVLQWIADTAYVHHQSGNENFEHLQSIARDALSRGEPT